LRQGEGWKKGTDNILFDLLEDWLGNGWEFVNPEEIAALTCAPILSNEVDRNNKGEIIKLGRIWWFPNYQVTDPINELWTEGCVLFDEGKT